MAVYLEMVASAAEPNQATFTLMMRTAAASGRLQHALAVFGEMKAAGIAPNLDIYNHLIVACGNSPQPQVRIAHHPLCILPSHAWLPSHRRVFLETVNAQPHTAHSSTPRCLQTPAWIDSVPWCRRKVDTARSRERAT